MIIIKQRCVKEIDISLDFAVMEHTANGYELAIRGIDIVRLFKN